MVHSDVGPHRADLSGVPFRIKLVHSDVFLFIVHSWTFSVHTFKKQQFLVEAQHVQLL